MKKEVRTQVVVVGSGPAGYSAAFRCADLGLNTILVDKYKFLGGVCLNVGCIPSKYLLHIAKVIKEMKKLSKIGVKYSDFSIDLNTIRVHQKKVISQLSCGLQNMAKQRNVRIITGVAEFLTSNSIVIKTLKEDLIVNYDNIIIAVGSSPKRFSNIICNDSRIWNSTSAVSIPNIPKKFLILGSGIIGLEMATVYSTLGSQVDIIDSSHSILSNLDRDIVSHFNDIVYNDFKIMLNSNIVKIDPTKNGLLVFIKDNLNNIEFSKLYDNILISIGRTPNSHLLNINNIGLEVDDCGYITIDSQCRTNISHVYAIGDVVGQPMLAHKAMHQGHIAAESIFGLQNQFNPRVIPFISYTEPEIAGVGITEKEAIKNNINYEVAIFPWIASGRAVSSQCSEGMTKLIFNKDTNRIIGGFLVGTNAGELLGEISLAIEMGCDAEDLALTIHAHPTLYESINVSSQIFQGTVTDFINSKKNK